MGDRTKISWCDATWNPTRCCTRVSAGCENCYAERVARRFSGPGRPYEGLVRVDEHGKAKAQWNGVIRLVPSARDGFAGGWDSINGAREGCAWADDPWVWVVRFERVGNGGET